MSEMYMRDDNHDSSTRDDLGLPIVKKRKINPDEQVVIIEQDTNRPNVITNDTSDSRKKKGKHSRKKIDYKRSKHVSSNFDDANCPIDPIKPQVVHECDNYSHSEGGKIQNYFVLNANNNNSESSDLISNPEMSPISPSIINNLSAIGIDHLFPIQNQLIPHILNGIILGNDICVCAPTGSGKTLTYVIPIVQTLSHRIVKRLRALVILPTRELVLQISTVFTQISNGTSLTIQPLYKKIFFCCPDILVTTPGILTWQLQKCEDFTLKHLQFLVIDEADKLLMSTYFDWLDPLMNSINTKTTNRSQTSPLPIQRSLFANIIISNNTAPMDNPNRKIQKLLFSATQTHNPQKIASLDLTNSKYFQIIPPDEDFTYFVPQTLEQHSIICEQNVKPLVLCHLVKQFPDSQILCFTSSIQTAYRLNKLLHFMTFDREMEPNFLIHDFSSLLPINQRIDLLNKFKNGRKGLLICSDIMARGIDLKSLNVVINYDLPLHSKGYVHRVGRTGRANKSGKVYSLVTSGEVQWFKQMILERIKNSHQIFLDMNSCQIDIQTRKHSYLEALRQLQIHIEKCEMFTSLSSIPLDTTVKSEQETIKSLFKNNFNKIWTNEEV